MSFSGICPIALIHHFSVKQSQKYPHYLLTDVCVFLFHTITCTRKVHFFRKKQGLFTSTSLHSPSQCLHRLCRELTSSHPLTMFFDTHPCHGAPQGTCCLSMSRRPGAAGAAAVLPRPPATSCGLSEPGSYSNAKQKNSAGLPGPCMCSAEL